MSACGDGVRRYPLPHSRADDSYLAARRGGGSALEPRSRRAVSAGWTFVLSGDPCVRLLLQIALVSIGSAAGGLTRWGVAVAAARWFGTAFPWGTFFINISGSLFLGWFSTVLTDRLLTQPLTWIRPDDLRLLVAVGFTLFFGVLDVIKESFSSHIRSLGVAIVCSYDSSAGSASDSSSNGKAAGSLQPAAASSSSRSAAAAEARARARQNARQTECARSAQQQTEQNARILSGILFCLDSVWSGAFWHSVQNVGKNKKR